MSATKIGVLCGLVLVLLVLGVVLLVGKKKTPQPTLTCTHYASPSGVGNGLSQGSPFQISQFWAVATAGSILCLADGVYKGTNSMIDPPDGKKGVTGNPIIVRALNEGQVLIHGENARRPVSLDNDNDWFVLEGINACCSNGSVVSISDGSDDNWVKRVVAWHSKDDNYEIFGAHNSQRNDFEDAAGFGIARKIFQFSQGGDKTTCRRCWGRWERSTWVGPKMTYTMVYNNNEMLCENCLGQWSGALMPATYVLGCPEGSTYAPCGTTFTGGAVDQPYGIFSGDRQDDNTDAKTRLLGSIAYVLATDDFRGSAPVRMHQAAGVDLTHVLSFIAPGTHTSKPSFVFSNGSETVASTADHISGVSNTAPGTPGSLWTVTNTQQATSVAGLGDSVWNGPNGAAICYRYEDGALTSMPLWPWPMNQRILEATTAAGVQAIDITATMETLFGTIPSACRWDVATLQPPLSFHKVSP